MVSLEKIIAIGLNKTGTRSLNAIFKEVPKMRTLHNLYFFTEEVRKYIGTGHKIFRGPLKHYGVFSDIWYPTHWGGEYSTQNFRSKVCHKLRKEKVRFILNIRDKDSWIKSRMKHETAKGGKCYVELWSKEYDDHYGFLKKFEDKDCFWLDICGGDSPQKLFDWLKIDCEKTKFPHYGKST